MVYWGVRCQRRSRSRRLLSRLSSTMLVGSARRQILTKMFTSTRTVHRCQKHSPVFRTHGQHLAVTQGFFCDSRRPRKKAQLQEKSWGQHVIGMLERTGIWHQRGVGDRPLRQPESALHGPMTNTHVDDSDGDGASETDDMLYSNNNSETLGEHEAVAAGGAPLLAAGARGRGRRASAGGRGGDGK